MVTEIFIGHLISKGDQFSESVYHKTKSYLPFIARLCLLSSFVQDNLMVASYWEELLQMLKEFEDAIVVVFIILCFIARAFGCVMILLQKKVPLACGLLFVSSVLQLFITSSITDSSTLVINAAVLGSLVILLAESKGESSSLFAGVPTLDNNKTKDYLKLSGRCLLILMFINFISLQASLLLILQDILGCALMIVVILGYKTKLSVLVTIFYLNVINLYENNWWTISTDNGHYYRLYVKHKFLQGVSVTGGLLMIVLHGPGGISIDKAKKIW